MEDKDHKYLCWLAGIRGIGRKKKFALLQAAGEVNLFSMEAGENAPAPGMAARVLYTAPEKELRFLWGESGTKPAEDQKGWEAILNARRQEPERIEEKLAQAGIGFISAPEKGFPEKLREIPDPPFGIYYKGSMPSQEEPAAAIIGARLASGYGREQARRFGRQIGARGIAVISGMARGIDGIAQKAALDAGGKSFAVLGCGVDICYPEENRELYERLQQEGGVLSEYPPGMQPVAKLFPPRNRIISGLSDLVLVIEARKRSGTLITVDMALEQGREVYALPGRVSDSLSDGCNRLIRQGAGPATCPQDILEFFFGTGSEEGRKRDRNKAMMTKKEAVISARISLEHPELEKNQTDARRKIIKQQDTGQLDVSREGENLHEEMNSEQMSPVTLDRRILRLLSTEDEKHVERILEEIRNPDSLIESEKPEDTVSLSDLISCLMRMKIDGRVEESPAGYYRKK